jgi:conjugative transposon TraM protein
MKTQQHPVKFLRQRKFLVALPVLVLPFVTMGFWALGGGKSTNANPSEDAKGLNLNLPDANFKKDKAIDKLGYYEKADEDSFRLKQLVKKDPYSSLQFQDEDSPGKLLNDHLKPDTPATDTNYTDANEAKVYKKLNELNNAMNSVMNPQKTETIRPLTSNTHSMPERAEPPISYTSPGDTSLRQLNTILDKVLDVQYPDRVRNRIQEKSAVNTGEVFAVSTVVPINKVGLLDGANPQNHYAERNYFFDAGDLSNDSSSDNSIEAVVHETKILVNGAVVKLRLLNDIYINGRLIAKDKFIYGIATLNNERLEINVNSIRDNNFLYPVKLDVYDLDGLRGIYMPGSITRNAAKQSEENIIQSMALSSLDPSIGAQAASAGIEAAKNLLTKKVKLVKVQVKAGYKVLLKTKN